MFAVFVLPALGVNPYLRPKNIRRFFVLQRCSSRLPMLDYALPCVLLPCAVD